MAQDHRIRIDPILVNKLLRIPGGINEIGVKIVRDLGLQYAYDKHSHNLDIIGPNSDILSIAIETLRFWVEDDDYPNTGVTCQVGYPNKCMVIWRFHGDYAKKLDHLFTEDIARLKKIPTVNVKAVPSKRNPEYVEMYCHFTVYNRVKDDVIRLSSELSRICQDDFFVPHSDYMKARRFARSKANDGSVLYALKEYPDRNRVRVWIFGREQIEVIRAKREWIQHVGNINSDAEFKETIIKDGGVDSARFYGHPSASTSRDSFSSQQNLQQHTSRFNPNVQQISPRSQQGSVVTSKNLSSSRRRQSTARSNRSSKKTGVKIPEFDNKNFPRPSNFVYPIDRQTVPEALKSDEDAYGSNPFNLNELNDINEETRLESPSTRVAVIGQSGWEKSRGPKFPPKHHMAKTAPNRIYVHYQVNDNRVSNGEQWSEIVTQVIHPETNLMPKERFKTRPSERVLTSVIDPRLAPAVKRNKNMRPGNKRQLQPKVMAFTRQKPVLEANKKQNVRYHINVNGLDIYMYKHNIVKLPDMEAIVNVVNGDIKPGGHLAENILDMVGPQAADEIKVYMNTHGPLRVAENMVSSAGRLPVLGIIHVAGPVWDNYLNISEEECARDLHKAIYGSLKTAEKHKYRKIGMPVVSSESFFGVPRDLVADVHVKALVDYSMGMGPLYPVLEVHLVDPDVDMLTHVKDAYEKWATDYNMVEMTQHVKSDLPSQQELSERTQSAVMLKEFPSHRSENMVTFVEQAYTAEGNQMWTFDILKKLVVHVYTGSIVRLKDVEAIACGVNSHLKGSLARQVLNVGGLPYDVALKRARGDRDLIEGDVLVSEAGNLATDLVLHSIVTQPVHVISEKNLVRLDRIYSQVLQAANKLAMESLAMPLIGTGRLREKFEIEQCSLQLIDNVIELCLSHGKALRLRELHLVNVNNVMTQTLTQALRTRAHTKLRIETDPHPPSRQEVLSLPDHMLQTPDLQRSLLSARKPTETDLAEEFKTLADMTRQDKRRTRQFQTVDEMNKAIMDKARSEKTSTLNDKVTESVTLEKKTLKTTENVQEKAKPNEHHRVHIFNAHTGNYLSKENLQEHTRMISNAAPKEEHAEKRMDKHEQTGKHSKPSKDQKITTSKHEENNENTSSQINKPSKESQAAVVEKLFKPVKARKRQRLPPLTGLVPMSSRAESYRSIHIRRQRLAAQMIKDQQVPVRRTSSVTNMHNTVDGPLELRDKFVRKPKPKPVKGGDDDERRENFKKETQNYFTRGTKDRYKITDNKIDVPKTSRTISNDDETHLASLQQGNGRFTERSGMDRKTSRTHVKERVLWDKEREDMYMKEMDMFILATNETMTRQTPVPGEANNPEVPESGHKPQQTQPKSARRTDNHTQAHRMPEQTSARGNAVDSNGRTDNIKDPPTATDSGKYQPNGSGKEPLSESRTTTHDHGHNHLGARQLEGMRDTDIVVLNIDKPTSQVKKNKSLQNGLGPQTDMAFEESMKYEKPASINANHNLDDTKTRRRGTEHDSNQTDIGAMAPESTPMVTTSSTKLKPVKLVISSELLPSQEHGHVQTHVDATQDNTASNESPDPLGQKSSQVTASKPTTVQTTTPKTDDVVIRDKLTVEIDVEDNLTRDSSNITREKAKIKRFWQVVGGKDVENETKLYGDDAPVENEKVLMTRVRKERKMSAKSKSSKQTEGTNVASQKLGKYNVTVEVV